MAVASNNALLGVGRLNAFRLNYLEAGLKRTRDQTLAITLNGVPLRVRRGSLQIHDVINDAPNTCTLTVDDATPPTVGGRLKVVLGVDPKYTLFVGTLQAARQSYVGRVHADVWDCEAIDDTARADWRRPFGAWESVSATNVAYNLITNFCPGFTANGVQLNLPPVTVYLDGTERVNGALRLLAKLIGGYYYFEDYDLHLFQGDEPGANPDDVTGAGLLETPRLAATSDDAQIRTRCFGKGHAENTLAAVNAGETILPLESVVMFNPAGGKAICEWQRLIYTGTVIGGDGALVGPGVTPSAALTAAIAAGSGVTVGGHYYAYTWYTGAGGTGETLPSPIAAIQVVGGAIGAATNASFGVSSGVQLGGPPAGTVMDYRLYISDGAGHLSPPSAQLRLVSTGYRPLINFMSTADMAGRYVYIYRTDNNGQGWALVTLAGAGPGYTTPFPPNQPAGYGFQWTDYTVSFTGGAPSPPAGGDLTNPTAVQLSGIAVGPPGTLYRRIYRSPANDPQLKFLVGFADNTTTAYLDTQADSTLQFNAPTADTSGLQMPAGQLLPGAASMPVSSTAWARGGVGGGGWAVVGNGAQLIRYTGVSGNLITGIPASGPGAVIAAVNYNSTITGAPLLLNVVRGDGSTPIAAIRAGAPVNIWIQIDDTGAQAALAARVGGAGIVEHLISDERRGEPSLIALCTADLALYGRPIVTVRYTTFDPKSRSGRPVRVHLTQPAIDQTLIIQDVTIAHDGTIARFAVTASSVRYALEDLLRRMVGTLEEGF